MKVLISAYACNPYQGSEPGVGWTAVCRIARKHDVFVLLDSHNKDGWDRAYQENIIPKNVQVRFLRRTTHYLSNRFLARIQSWLWYAEFNRIVLKAARDWHDEENFDLCHQVTIAAWRMPSPLWKLPIPFIWGPIGGAGYIPPEFRSMLSPSARLFERARDFSTWFALRSRNFRDCLENTGMILAANQETETLLKPFRKHRSLRKLPIVSLSPEKIQAFKRKHPTDTSGPLRLFAGGNIIGSKGVSLALKALAKVKARGIEFRYTIAGGGPDIPHLVKLANELGIAESIDFQPGFSGQDYIDALQSAEIFLLPSFREGTPVTMIEACIAGCYPVVVDTSAQGELVALIGGSAVPLSSIEGVVSGLAEQLIQCHGRRDELLHELENGRARLCELLHSDRYDQVVDEIYHSVVATKPPATPLEPA